MREFHTAGLERERAPGMPDKSEMLLDHITLGEGPNEVLEREKTLNKISTEEDID
jgi:hypothetical protein